MSSNLSSAHAEALSVDSLMASLLTPTTAALTLSLALLTYAYLPPLFQDKKSIRHLGGFSLLTAWPFFSKRYDFLKSGFKKTGEQFFQFNVLHVRRRPSSISLFSILY
jgi:hypothetical protein